MNPSSHDGSSNKMLWNGHPAAPAPSSREEEMAELQQYYDQNGINVTVMPNRDYFLPRYVDHTYRDFSNYIREGNRIEKHKKCDRNFPALLHTILSNDQYSHIISWMPHGRAWKIHDKDLLMEEVVPDFFGQSKYASFARQLSGWGFKRLHQTGADFGCYYHECFLRGHPKLTILMRRVSPGQGKVTPNMNAEPDFYSIAEQFPLLDEPADVGAPTNHSGSGRVVVKKAGASFSEPEKRKTDAYGGRNEALGFKDGGGDPLLNGKADAAMERRPQQHQWDPFDQPEAAYPPYHEGSPDAAVKNYDGNSINHSSKSKQPVGDRSDDAKTYSLSDQESSKYDPLPYRHPQPRPISYRDRGFSDPFPTSTYPSHLNGGYSMHPPHNEYYRPGANINQYAYSGNQHHVHPAAASYYYPPPHYPHHPQYQHNNAEGTSMYNYDYWYRNQYYGAQGLDQAQGFYPPPPRDADTNTSELQHSNPRDDPRHPNPRTPPPTFSPLRSLREDENETNH